ncbi:hypothetical protein [Streptomyces sp. WMMB 322]|uniref:hypothetical protein n=1 Tax=Streptomyces sp. WMMB 322 TaxID=1286821 RepID=UPI0006E1868D|nr:hypothetical protein [Streptomyces sp. WMMB 322]SCK30968.1 hypothetical protein H180DRAFT_02432 [Streptomyces sp. WMMB 322]
MAEANSRPEKLRAAALKATDGRQPSGLFRVSRAVVHDSLETPWKQRPWVLSGPGVKRAPLRKLFVIAVRTLTFDWPVRKIQFSDEKIAAKERAESARASNKPQADAARQAGLYFGTANSTAAQLLVATLPRSKTRVMNLLCVTADDTMLLHIPDTYRKKHFANAVDIGWRIDRKQLEWTRDISGKGGSMREVQYGFADGSWMTLYTESVESMPGLTDVFPHTLTKEDPIPPNANYPEPELRK